MRGLGRIGLWSLLVAGCASSAPAERIDPDELRARPPGAEGAGEDEPDPPPAEPSREELLAGCLEAGDPPPPDEVAEPYGAVTEAIEASEEAVRVCYEGLLQREPDARGCMMVRFTVGADGTVDRVRVTRTTLQDLDFTQCMTNVMQGLDVRDWTSAAPVRFAYPFVFAPES